MLDGFAEVARNFTSLAGVIGIVYGLFRWAKRRKNVACRATPYEINLPPSASSEAMAFRSLLSDLEREAEGRLRAAEYEDEELEDDDDLEGDDQMNTETATVSEVGEDDEPDTFNERVKAVLAKTPEKLFSKYSPGSVFRWETRWVIEVKNHGNVEVKDLELSLPFSGIYTTDAPDDPDHEDDEDGGQAGVRDFKKTIKLGSLRPRRNIEVQVWTESGYPDLSNDRIVLTDSEGRVPIDFPRRIYGLWGTIAAEIQTAWVFLLILTAIVASSYAASLIPSHRNSANSPSSRPATVP
ncbi:MAG TPA: hypothetical protein VGI81_10570 [Tepidisphaeraceae bacterium]|jgi:hypothetical protein